MSNVQRNFFVSSSGAAHFFVALLVASSLASLTTAGCSAAAPAQQPDGAAVGSVDEVLCATPDPGTLDYLDDMEDGNALILQRAARTGQWYTYNDGTKDAKEEPAPMTVPAMESIPKTRCGYSSRAMRVTGSGFADWGAGFGFDLSVAMVAGVWTRQPYDATPVGARGITFWARRGDPSLQTMFVGVSDKWSDPIGGACDDKVTIGPTACYDNFGTTVELSTTWKRYAFSWGQLGQRAFGLPRLALDTQNLVAVHFDVPDGPVFDVWVDDVAFYQ